MIFDILIAGTQQFLAQKNIWNKIKQIAISNKAIYSIYKT